VRAFTVSMLSAFEGLAALVERIVNPAGNVVALRAETSALAVASSRLTVSLFVPI
jgi:hypothetical protein